MANVAHSTLSGANLHEPKGVAAAAADKLYVSDGAGSGSWTTVPRAALAATATPALVHLATNTPSAASSSTFTTGFSSSYSAMLFVLDNVITSSNADDLKFQISTDGGSSYHTSSYQGASIARGNGGTVNVDNMTGDFRLTQASSAALSNEINVGFSGQVWLQCLGSKYKTCTWSGVYDTSGGGVIFTQGGGYFSGNTSVINAARFILTTGTITGTIRMYGISAS